MSIWYPRFPLQRLPAMLWLTALGALLAGGYGALHDQISYTISPEYFTRFKFDQFAWADLDWPPRLFAAEIGFLASWWVGLIAGWVLARFGLAELLETPARLPVLKAYALVLGTGALTGCLGMLLGVLATQNGDLSAWSEWREQLGLQDVRGFVIVAYLHAASYVGGLLGLLLALGYVRREVTRQRRTAAPPPGPCCDQVQPGAGKG